MKFFRDFPLVQYNNSQITNITIRLKIREIIQKNDFDVWPYKIKNDERPDIIAYKYYDNSELDWLVLLMNNIYDPYFDWPMRNETLIAHIEKKYGSLDAALATVVYYTDEEGYKIDKTTYDSLAPEFRSSVNGYEYEFAENDRKRDIKLLSKDRANDVVRELSQLLNSKASNSYYRRISKVSLV